MSLLTTYIQHAMRRAVIECIEDGTYVGEVPGLQGVLANAPTPEECETELAEVIEGWVLCRIANGMPIPEIDGNTVVAVVIR